MASLKDMFFSLSESMIDTMKMYNEHGMLRSPEVIEEKRTEICLGCPNLDMSIPGLARCNICGCLMNLKVRLAAASCPLPEKKWNSMSPEEIDRYKESGQ